VAFIGVVSTIALGAVAWKALSFDPSMLALIQNIYGHVAGIPQEDQEYLRLQSQFAVHYGFINSSGMCVIPPAFEKTRSFSEGLCAVRVNKKWGFINKRGEMVIKPKFSKVMDFSEGLAAVREGAVWGYLDRAGNYLVKPSKWLAAGSFKNGLAIVVDGTRQGIIYRSGEYICRDLDSVGPLANGFYCIKKGGLYGFIRQDGRAFIEPKYEDASDFSEGLAAVAQSKKWGYIDTSFKTVIAPRFTSAEDFHRGLAVVSESGKYGIIDNTGAFRLQPIYRYLSAIPPIDTTVNGKLNVAPPVRAVVSTSPTHAKIDTATCTPGMGVSTILVDGIAYSSAVSGSKHIAHSKVANSVKANVFVPMKLSDGSELTPIEVNQQWGFADASGTLAIPAQFADVRLFSEGLASVASFDRPEQVANHIRASVSAARLNEEEERAAAADEERLQAKKTAFIASEAKRRGISPDKVAAEIREKEEAGLDSEP
jgi:hypothetical protein